MRPRKPVDALRWESFFSALYFLLRYPRSDVRAAVGLAAFIGVVAALVVGGMVIWVADAGFEGITSRWFQNIVTLPILTFTAAVWVFVFTYAFLAMLVRSLLLRSRYGRLLKRPRGTHEEASIDEIIEASEEFASKYRPQ